MQLSFHSSHSQDITLHRSSTGSVEHSVWYLWYCVSRPPVQPLGILPLGCPEPARPEKYKEIQIQSHPGKTRFRGNGAIFCFAFFASYRINPVQLFRSNQLFILVLLTNVHAVWFILSAVRNINSSVSLIHVESSILGVLLSKVQLLHLTGGQNPSPAQAAGGNWQKCKD